MEFKDHEGTITNIDYNLKENMIVSSSCDGMLGVFDLKKGELFAMSDNFEEDLQCVCLMKENKKVLAATSEGVINIFSWGDFGDCNDRITGHSSSIDTMIHYNEDIIITGCEDGMIRALNVLPNKIISILGDPIDISDGEIFGI